MQLQIIEVAIGLVAAFFIVSLVASAAVEVGSTIFRKRSKDLRIVLDTMLSRGSTNAVDLHDTSVWKTLESASRRKRGVRKEKDKRTPSYMSARAFGDAVIEGLVKLKQQGTTMTAAVASLPAGPLKERITTLQAELGDDLVAIKAGLEGWFDDTMDRLEGAYKRWSQWFLLLFGLVFAAILNVSAIRVVDSLWNDATLRTAIADSATKITDEACPVDKPDCKPEEKIDKAINDLDTLKLPVGWSEGWSTESGAGWTLLGIVPTGLAVMMGAPFWFDLLARLIGARGNRGVPPKASDDRGSATFDLAANGATRLVRPLTAL